jgi:hypothetical protein
MMNSEDNLSGLQYYKDLLEIEIFVFRVTVSSLSVSTRQVENRSRCWYHENDMSH